MIIHVKVRPGSSKESVEKIDDGNYIIYTHEKAIDGKANLEVIRLLAKEFNVNFRDVIIKNPRSRKKIIEIIK